MQEYNSITSQPFRELGIPVTMNDIAMIAGILVAVTGAIIGIKQVIYPLWKKVHILFDTWSSFVRDWNGEEAAPGRQATPGVMERLNKLDGELTHNGGKSVKDVVVRLEEQQVVIFDKLDEADKRRSELQEALLAAIKSLGEAGGAQAKTRKPKLKAVNDKE